MKRTEKNYAKWVRDEDGEFASRYRAIDPAGTAMIRGCRSDEALGSPGLRFTRS